MFHLPNLLCVMLTCPWVTSRWSTKRVLIEKKYCFLSSVLSADSFLLIIQANISHQIKPAAVGTSLFTTKLPKHSAFIHHQKTRSICYTEACVPSCVQQGCCSSIFPATRTKSTPCPTLQYLCVFAKHLGVEADPVVRYEHSSLVEDVFLQSAGVTWQTGKEHQVAEGQPQNATFWKC